MRRGALTLALLVVASAAAAQAPDADAPTRPGGWIRDDYGVWRRVEGAYHVAYVRRGCRVEEDWDGRQYSAQVRCRPGVKPD
jgi:hypothetical protein